MLTRAPLTAALLALLAFSAPVGARAVQPGARLVSIGAPEPSRALAALRAQITALARLAAAQPARPLRVAVVSDMNGRYGSVRYRGHVHDAIDWLTGPGRPDFVLSTGDMVAGMRPGLDYDAMWASFHAAVTDRLAAAGVFYAPTPGNHDAAPGPRYAPERAAYRRAWAGRAPAGLIDGSDFPARYAFVRAGALFVSIPAASVGPLSADDRAWIDAVLSAHASLRAKIVFGHVPLAPFARGRESETLRDPALEALLGRHGVSVYLSGHHHAYFPGQRGHLRMVSMPCLGGGPRALLGTERASERAFVLLSIDPKSGFVSVEARRAQGARRPIERATLPRRVGAVWRDDLVVPDRAEAR